MQRPLRETANLIGSKASAEVLDVADQAAIEDLVKRVEAAHGGIDLFVSNAGYALGGGLNLDTDQWRDMMEVHLWAHLNAARAVVPGMIARGGGYLLNTASAAGLLTQLDSGPYAVSKHAAVALAEWLAIQLWRPRHWRFSVVSTGCPHQPLGQAVWSP